MAYGLGVDLGTTFTAAAVRVGGRVQVARLGTRRAGIPSLVFVRSDGTVVVGEAAERRGAIEPGRLAREVNRRFGDHVPILLGDTPFAAHELLAHLLEHVVRTVADQRDAPPGRIVVTHPAGWGPFKRELLERAARRAGLPSVALRSAPEAAAAAVQDLRPGDAIAVYDLGGTTFDAAVVRLTDAGPELLGQPESIEQLGGIDFDEAVLDHVRTVLGDRIAHPAADDVATTAALAQLRRDCVEAKEMLSVDTQVVIPVALPALTTGVRLGRPEFEAMIRPLLADTVAATHRALRSAGVTADQLRSIVLAGGSSRIPLVGQLVAAEFGRPVVLDAAPEHLVVVGAARSAAPAEGAAPAPAPAATGPVWPASATVTRPAPRAARVRAVATAPDGAVVPPPGRRRRRGRHARRGPLAPMARRLRRAVRRRLLVGATVIPVAVVLLVVAAVAVAARVLPDWDAPSGAASSESTTATGPQVVPRGRWERAADLPVALERAAVAAHGGRLWVAGGVRDDATGSMSDAVHVYDPATRKWSTGPALPRPTTDAALVSTPGGLYLFGGAVATGGSQQVLRLGEFTRTWVEQQKLPQARTAGAAGFDGTQILYAGGARRDGTAADEIWGYRNNTWTRLATLNRGRQALAAVSDGSRVLFLAGLDGRAGARYGDIDRVSQGMLAAARPGTSATVDPPVDAAGGVRLDGIGACLVGGQTGPDRYNDWWCEQPGAAAALPRLDPPRAGLGVARIGRTVYVVGGRGNGFRATNRVETYTPPA